MRSLFAANWYLMRKSGIVWWICLALLAIAVFVIIAGQYTAADGYVLRYEQGPIQAGAIVVGAAAAVLCGALADNAYREGTIRNEITAGHTRGQVFWASYLAYTTASLLMLACYVLPLVAADLVFNGPFDRPDAMRDLLVCSVCLVPAYTALYCAIGAVGGRKGVGIACLASYIALMAVGLWIDQRLNEPEMFDTYDYQVYRSSEDGTQTSGEMSTEMVSNPAYVPYPARGVLEFFSQFLPPAQSVRIIYASPEPAGPLYTLGFSALCWVIGVVAMQRRNIS